MSNKIQKKRPDNARPFSKKVKDISISIKSSFSLYGSDFLLLIHRNKLHSVLCYQGCPFHSILLCMNQLVHTRYVS